MRSNPQLTKTGLSEAITFWRAGSYQNGQTIASIAGAARPVVIPDRKEVPVFIIKNYLGTTGITREEYFPLPEKL